MADAVLEIRGLNVFYGRSHALQGIDLTLPAGVLSVVGRNGMGKTTLCKAIMGLVPIASGTIRFAGEEIAGLGPTAVARRGIGYVPQGRRLWPSLTVDEHLRLARRPGGAWSADRVYGVFPRLAERRHNGGGQLSGGEQQMLAIGRALLANPRLLVMDEPTEGLAPVIVAQVEEMLTRLADEGALSVLVIEQNIGVATEVSDTVAIMVNGRINRIIDSATIAADRDLQQRLLGVGRHAHDETESAPAPTVPAEAVLPRGPARIYIANPTPPTRWSQPVPVARLEMMARTTSAREAMPVAAALRPLTASGEPIVLVAGTLDTKGAELRFIREKLREAGVRVRLVDLSTTAEQEGSAHTGADVPAHQIAAHHPRGPGAVFTGDRGRSVAGMADAFAAWMARQGGVAGIISAGGSGGTVIATAGMRTLAVGVPKVMISTVASGNVAAYVGTSDILMLHSVTDVQGLNVISRQVLGNGAAALAGMVRARERRDDAPALPAIGLTMFGVTTRCVQQVTAALAPTHDCLVFHATGLGGQSMERLIDQGQLQGVIDVTTTEICDMMMGGTLPATEDRFGAVIRTRMPYVGSCGALDMVNFAAPETVPVQYAGRRFYQHNPQVTLMRTTPEENARMGVWIGERLNRMEGPVRFLLPLGGVSALDVSGGPFWDPAADAALFEALERTVRQTANRRLVRLPHNVNDAPFAAALVTAFQELHGRTRGNRRIERAAARGGST